MTTPLESDRERRVELKTDHIVRYQNGLACLTSVSFEDAETVARLLRESGVADVRVWERVIETREREIGVPGSGHTATTGCKEWMTAHGPCTDNESYGRLIRDDNTTGSDLPAIRFCPWCGEVVR